MGIAADMRLLWSGMHEGRSRGQQELQLQSGRDELPDVRAEGLPLPLPEDELVSTWIESHAEIWEHHKLDNLVERLTAATKLESDRVTTTPILPAGLDPDEVRVLVVGHLHSLWHFAVRNAWRDGDLTKWGPTGIERAARWKRQPGVLHSALKAVGFLDADKDRIHDWLDFAGQLVKKRIQRERFKDAVGRQDDEQPPAPLDEEPEREPSGNRPGTDQEPNGRLPTVPTVPTEPNQPNRTKRRVAGPAEPPQPIDAARLETEQGKSAAKALAACKSVRIANPACLDAMARACPDVDLARVVRACEAWATANEVKRSPKGWQRSLNTWATKEQDRAKGRPGSRTAGSAMKPQGHGGKYANVGG